MRAALGGGRVPSEQVAVRISPTGVSNARVSPASSRTGNRSPRLTVHAPGVWFSSVTAKWSGMAVVSAIHSR